MVMTDALSVRFSFEENSFGDLINSDFHFSQNSTSCSGL
jgi:hypothetical protein